MQMRGRQKVVSGTGGAGQMAGSMGLPFPGSQTWVLLWRMALTVAHLSYFLALLHLPVLPSSLSLRVSAFLLLFSFHLLLQISSCTQEQTELELELQKMLSLWLSLFEDVSACVVRFVVAFLRYRLIEVKGLISIKSIHEQMCSKPYTVC